MKVRLFGVLILAAISMLLVGVAACGDDDDDGDDGGDDATAAANEDLDLYFQDLVAIQTDLSEGIGTIDEHADAAFADPAAARQSLNAVSTAGQAAMTDLQGLDVPAEATDAHNELESAGTAYLSSVDALADELQTVSAGEEFDAFIAGIDDPESDFQKAKANLQEACDGMQQVADDNSIDVALECPV